MTKLITIITIALTMTACLMEEQFPISDPTPTHPPPRPTLPNPIAHIIPEGCQFNPDLLPQEFSNQYWATVIRNQDDLPPEAITITNVNRSSQPYENVDWHSFSTHTLTPWGTSTPDELTYVEATQIVNDSIVPPGSFIRVITPTSHDLLDNQPADSDPIPAIVVNQDNRFWNYELLIRGAARPNIDAAFLFRDPDLCINPTSAASLTTTP